MTPELFRSILRKYLTDHIGALPAGFLILVEWSDDRWFVQFLFRGKSVWAIQTRNPNCVLDALDEECLFVAERMRGLERKRVVA